MLFMFVYFLNFDNGKLKSNIFYKKYLDLKARIQINDAILDKCMQSCCRNVVPKSKKCFQILSIIYIKNSLSI